MSTSQGTYVRIEQTAEAIRVTYEICRVGGTRTGIENRCSKVWGAILARPTRRATYHRALGSREFIPQNERELRCSEGSGVLIGDPLR